MARRLEETSADLLSGIAVEPRHANVIKWFQLPHVEHVAMTATQEARSQRLLYLSQLQFPATICAVALLDFIGGGLLGLTILCVVFALLDFSESLPLWIVAAIGGSCFYWVRRLSSTTARRAALLKRDRY